MHLNSIMSKSLKSKTISDFRHDLENCYRSSLREYSTQDLVCFIQFYPRVKMTDSIKGQQKEIQRRIDGLKKRLMKQKLITLKNEDELKEMEESFLRHAESKLEKTIISLKKMEDELNENINRLRNIEDSLSTELNVRLNELNTKPLDNTIEIMFSNSFKIKENIPEPLTTGINDVISLDGKAVSSSKMIKGLMSLVYHYRHKNNVTHSLDKVTDVIFNSFSESYKNILKLAVYNIRNKIIDNWHCNHLALNVITSI
jgi:superfamily I DNA and/or RNA helicase